MLLASAGKSGCASGFVVRQDMAVRKDQEDFGQFPRKLVRSSFVRNLEKNEKTSKVNPNMKIKPMKIKPKE